jgi:hypothetical protein
MSSQTGLVGSCSLKIEQQELKPPHRTKEEKSMTGATGREQKKKIERQSGTNRRLEKSGRESLLQPAHEDSMTETGDND